jgi:hypothetical protein
MPDNGPFYRINDIFRHVGSQVPNTFQVPRHRQRMDEALDVFWMETDLLLNILCMSRL